MNTNKMQIDLSIPSMQSTHCQNRVGNEVSKIKGVEIQNLESGKLTVLLTDESLKENVTSVIEKAGYSVSNIENDSNASCSTRCCTH
jgi:copper chaperone CopZ